MSMVLDPCRLSLPFLANPELRQTTHDPLAWAEAIQTTIPVRICEPLRPTQPFRNDTAVIQLGQVTLVTTHGSPITVRTDHTQGAQLLIPYRGDGLWTIDASHFSNPAGESLLYTPPAPLSLSNTVTSGVSLTLDPGLLLDTALAMAGPDASDADLLLHLERPCKLLLESPGCKPLINSIYTTLITADQAIQSMGPSIDMLRLDDLLTRLAVLLLVPVLRRDLNGNGPGQRTESNRLKPLLEWIEAHLDQPIALSELERISHFSRRSLQYSFRHTLGCTPMQWIRARRLEKAKARLADPLPGDSVASIARLCGYVNTSAFSRDFRKHHGCKPMEVFKRCY